MPTFTPNYNLVKPLVDSPVDEDLWGGQRNDNSDIIDTNLNLRTQNYDFANFNLIAAKMIDIREVINVIGGGSGALVLDYEDGHYQTATLTGNVTSLTINNWPPSGTNGFLSLEITQDATGGRTIDLTGGTFFTPGGVLNLTPAANAVDILRFESQDAGTAINVFINSEIQVIT